MKFFKFVAASLFLVPLALMAQAPIASFYNEYHPAVAGAGVAIRCGGSQSMLRGAYVCGITVSGNDIAIDFQDASSVADTLTFSLVGGGADGVITGATLAVDTQILTVMRSQGVDLTVDLSGLQTADEVTAAINAAADGVIEDVDLTFVSNTLNIEIDRTVGADLTSSVPLPIPNVVANPMTTPLNVLQELTIGTMDYVVGNVSSAVDLTVTAGVLSIEIDRVFGDHLVDSVALPAGGGGLDESEVDARVNTVAADACVDLTYVGSTLTCSQLDGGTDQVTIVAGATDGVADSLDLTVGGSTLTATLGLTVGPTLTATVTLPSGGLATVITQPPVSGAGSSSDPVTIDDNTIADVKIVGLAASKLTGEIEVGLLPAANALDSELPSSAQLVPATGTTGHVLTKTASAATFQEAPVDGVLTGATFVGSTLTLSRSGSLADVEVTGLGSAAGTFDGVVTGITFGTGDASHSMTLARSEGLDALEADLPFEVVEPAADGTLRAATAADLGRIARDHHNLRVATRQLLDITGRVVTIANYAATGYIGTETSCYNTGVTTLGATCYNRINHNWYLRVSAGWTNTGATPAGWIGAYASLEEAEEGVTAVGQIFYVTGSAYVSQVTAFTGPVANYEYHWEPEQERQALIARPVLPTPSTTNAGQFSRVTAAGDGYETAAITIPPQQLPAPTSTNALMYARVNSGGTAYETAAVTLTVPEEIYAVPPADVTLNDANSYTLANVPTVEDGLVIHFAAKAANTGAVTLSIDGTSYGILKHAEGGFSELFEGGEFQNGLPNQVVYDGGSFYWFGTVLGNAAQRDVGVIEGEVVALNADNEFPVAVMPSLADAVVTAGTSSKHPILMDNLDALLTRTDISPAGHAAESDFVGTTRRRIAGAIASAGITGVGLSGAGNIVTLTVTRPSGSTFTADYDFSQLEDIATLERLIAQLVDATGFHPGHDLVLADIINGGRIAGPASDGITAVVITHNDQTHLFSYSNRGAAQGIYYDGELIAALPVSTQISGSYGGAERVVAPPPGVGDQADRWVWIDGDNINIQHVGDASTRNATSWRTTCAAPAPWVSLSIAADSEVEADHTSVFQLLYRADTEAIRVCYWVVVPHSPDNTVTSASHVTFTLQQLGNELPQDKVEFPTETYDESEGGEGLRGIAVSRGIVWLLWTRLNPVDTYSSAPFTTYLLGFDAVLSGEPLQLRHNPDHDAEVPLSAFLTSMEVNRHPNIPTLEDVYLLNNGLDIYHYRDPDQIETRWVNILNKPAEATEMEMVLGTEPEIRLMSPLRIRDSLAALPQWQGAYDAAVTYKAGDSVLHNSFGWMSRTGSTGVEPTVIATTEWIHLDGTLLGANQLLAINDILKRIPRDVTIMAQRFGVGSNRSGWDRDERYHPDANLGIGSISEDPPSIIRALEDWTRVTVHDDLNGRLVLVTNEAASGRAFDGKAIRLNGTTYTLEYQERLGNQQRYRTTVTLPQQTAPANNEAARVTWTVNFEDYNEAVHDSLAGSPWEFHQSPGVPLLSGGADSTVADDVVNSLTLALNVDDDLVVTAEREVGANVVSNALDLGTLGGGTTVIANPGGSGTTLETLSIDGTTWTVPGSIADVFDGATSLPALTGADEFLVRNSTDSETDKITYSRLFDGINPDIYNDTTLISFGPPSIAFGTGLLAVADSGTNAVTITAAAVGSPPVVFQSSMQNVTGLTGASTSAAHRPMEILAANIEINEGGFTIETADDTSWVVFPSAGIYEIYINAYFTSATNVTTVFLRSVFEAAGTEVFQHTFGTTHLTAAQPVGVVEDIVLLDADVGDRVTWEMWNTGGSALTLAGATSDFAIIKIDGGVQGERGPPGADGAPGGTAAQVVDALVEGLDGDGTDDYRLGAPTLTSDFLAMWDEVAPTELSRVSVSQLGSIYVAANPSTTTGTLSSVRIGSTSYAVTGSGGTTVAFGDMDALSFDELTVVGTTLNARGDSTLGADLQNRLLINDQAQIPIINPMGNPVVRHKQYITLGDIRTNLITHQGLFVARDYNQGAVVRSSNGNDAVFWIASRDILASESQPTLSSPGAWFHLGQRAIFLGELGNVAYDFFAGSSWVYNDRLYFATADIADTSPFVASTHADVVDVSDAFHGKPTLATVPADNDLVLFHDTSADAQVTRTVAQVKAQFITASLPCPPVDLIPLKTINPAGTTLQSMGAMSRSLTAADDACTIEVSLGNDYNGSGLPGNNDGFRWTHLTFSAAAFRSLLSKSPGATNSRHTILATAPKCGTSAQELNSEPVQTTWFIGRDSGSPDSLLLSNLHWAADMNGIADCDSTWSVRMRLY